MSSCLVKNAERPVLKSLRHLLQIVRQNHLHSSFEYLTHSWHSTVASHQLSSDHWLWLANSIQCSESVHNVLYIIKCLLTILFKFFVVIFFALLRELLLQFSFFVYRFYYYLYVWSLNTSKQANNQTNKLTYLNVCSENDSTEKLLFVPLLQVQVKHI